MQKIIIEILLYIFCNNFEIVKYLVEQGADVNVKDNDNSTPLHYSSGCDYTKIVEYLVEQGADKKTTDNDGCTPLHYSTNSEIIKILLEIF